MLSKWADLTILCSKEGCDYGVLIKAYEKIAFRYLATNLIKSSAKDFLMKAAFCYLANQDLVGCQKQLEKYAYEDTSYEGSRQSKLVNSLVAACEAEDEEMFSKSVQEYGKYTPLDKVNTKLVVRAKQLYCPEPDTAVQAVTKEVNFIDGDASDGEAQEAAAPGGFDFT